VNNKMKNKIKLKDKDSIFSENIKLDIDKPKKWIPVIGVFISVLFLFGIVYGGYSLVLGTKDKNKIDPKSKIESIPNTENSDQSNPGGTSLFTPSLNSSSNIPNSTIAPTVSPPSGIYMPSTGYTSPSGTSQTYQPSTGSSYDPAYCTGLWNARTQAIAPKQAEITAKQNEMYNLMSSIRGRTSGSFVTESQIQALYAQEYAVLNSQLCRLKSELDTIKAQYPVC